jgi:hypothetical protein
MVPSFFVLLYPLFAIMPNDFAAGLFCEVWPWVGMSFIWTFMTQTSHIQVDSWPPKEMMLAACWPPGF